MKSARYPEEINEKHIDSLCDEFMTSFATEKKKIDQIQMEVLIG